MNPFGARGAEEFARALDAGAPEPPAVALADRLRTVGAAVDEVVVPRTEFRDALRTRLLAVAAVQAAGDAADAAPAAQPRGLRALEAALSGHAARRRGTAVTAGALASVVALSGVAVAGSQSLPGDPFYGVKRATEAIQLRTADGSVEKGLRHLAFAETRLREVRGLTLGRDAADAALQVGPASLSAGFPVRTAVQPLAAGDALTAPVTDRVRTTLAEMDEDTRKAEELLTGAYRSSRTPEPLRVLARFATRQSSELEELLPALPPATKSRARLSLTLLTDVSVTTDQLLGIPPCVVGCDPLPPPPPPVVPPPVSPAASPCCTAPAPEPAPQATAPPTQTAEPVPSSEPQPSTEPTSEPTPDPASPSPSSSPDGSPVPLPPPPPLPAPAMPLPLPGLALPTLEPVVTPPQPLATLLDRSSSRSRRAAVPAASGTSPASQVAPAPLHP